MTPYERVREEFAFPFELRPYQVNEVNDLCLYDRSGFYWEAGCVDADTEYLTPTGWARIADYAGGPVAQFEPLTGQASFVTPEKYIVAPCKEMIRIKTHYGLDQMLSHEHRVLLYRGDRPERTEVVSAASLLAEHDRVRRGEPIQGRRQGSIAFGHAAIRATFSAPGGAGIPLTDEQLRLQVAVIADGHFPRDNDTVVIRVKRDRKVQRLRVLLADAGVEAREKVVTEGTAAGFHVFTFKAPIRTKEFGPEFWAANQSQINLLALEVTYWDGHDAAGSRGFKFTSTSKQSADFVQYLWTVTGQVSRVIEDRREGKYRSGVCYEVIRRGENRTSGLLHLHRKSGPTMSDNVPTPDGFKYCFTVPSGFLVLRRNGCIFTTGNSGKTAGATHWMLHWLLTSGVTQWVLVMPPILLDQWARWLRSVKRKSTGQPMTVTVYQGTPKQRKTLSLDADFILMSYGILKKDFDRLYDALEHRNVGMTCDEGHAVKNIESDTHKAVKYFTEGRPLAILTGTPLTKPGDAYAYIRLIAPGVYRNRRQFERLHVKEMDDRENVLEWDNLELLNANMRIQTSRIIRREVRQDLPAIIYNQINYDLDPAHFALYKQIADERLVELEGGGEIDAISQQALASAMQQVIVNWAEFAEDPELKPAALELVEEVLDEIGEGGKLVVVANFVRSNRYLLKSLKKYGAVAIYGETSPPGRQQALRSFIEDPSCRCILLQPQSAGFGVDGLQHVCSEMLILEAPTTPPPFHQVVARLDRDGQLSPVNCRVAVANKTVQVRMFKNLLANDELVNSVQGGFKDLKEMVYGG